MSANNNTSENISFLELANKKLMDSKKYIEEGKSESALEEIKNTINFAKEYFDKNRLIIESVDKQAYLSSLALSKYIVVTCDSSSMISEAALTGKPIYVGMLPSLKNDHRFKKFRNLFKELNIIKELGDNLEIWSYEKLDETNRIAQEIKKKII